MFPTVFLLPLFLVFSAADTAPDADHKITLPAAADEFRPPTAEPVLEIQAVNNEAAYLLKLREYDRSMLYLVVLGCFHGGHVATSLTVNSGSLNIDTARWTQFSFALAATLTHSVCGGITAYAWGRDFLEQFMSWHALHVTAFVFGLTNFMFNCFSLPALIKLPSDPRTFPEEHLTKGCFALASFAASLVAHMIKNRPERQAAAGA